MPTVPQPDEIITSPQLPGSARVIVAIPEGGGVRIKAFTLDDEKFHDRLFQEGEFTIRRTSFDGDGTRFRLAALAERIRAAAQYDPQFAVGASQVDPLPHQIEAVYKHLLRSPRIRFLLADDPGAGKTIMAGLLMKELQYRGAVERTLIVTPANLTLQWADEIRTKFGEDFSMLRSEDLRATPGPALWQKHPRAIISIDLARRLEWLESFEGVHWDLVIVDEAHKMAAYKYGQKVDKTRAYQLGEALATRTDHFLLMTATPHRGDPDNFRLLLSLLDPDLFETNENIAPMLRQTTIPIFLRRLKEHMTDFDGKPLFPPRNVETVQYELVGIEKELYDAVTDYVAKRYERAQTLNDRAKRNVGLALAVLQRRLASSLRAIRSSLRRREDKLKVRLQEMRDNIPAKPIDSDFYDPENEPEDEEERWKNEDAILGLAPTVHNIKAMEEEITEVHALYLLAEEAEAAAETSDAERKLVELKRVLHQPFANGKSLWETGEKLLVFTENKDTLDYLRERFEAWGFRVASIFGGMDQQTRRDQQAYFKDPDGAQVMVATEAAGEGINLQFCRLMVNYDIPWNPNRLEQRMGRIHRYGQKYSVQIYNLVAENTREGIVLDTVLRKLDRMRDDLGSDGVYDIVGDLLSSTDLAELFERAVTRRQSLEEIRRSIGATVDARITANKQQHDMQNALIDALATDVMTATAREELYDEYRAAKEQRLVPEYVERFVVSAFRTLATDRNMRADIRQRTQEPGVWAIENVPHFIRQAAPAGYSIKPTYPRIIFNPALREDYPYADFVVPGHPLFESLLDLVRHSYGPALTSGARFVAPEGEQGLFWLLEMAVKDGNGEIAGKKLVGVHQQPDGTLEQQDPLALLDVEPLPAATATVPLLPIAFSALASTPQDVEAWGRAAILDPYLEKLRKRRAHEGNIREDYLNRSLNSLIADQDARVAKYIFDDRRRQRDPAQYDIGLRTLEQRLDEYRTRLAKRMDESTRLRSLGADPPRVIGVSAYLPAPPGMPEMETDSDPVSEDVSTLVATEYEQSQNRTPQDVARDNLGFDMRSIGAGEIRYIEIKGRKHSGPVMLTANEWIKAARFGAEYWLYVVYDCATPQPRLVCIQDPASCLTVAEDVFTAARFRVNVGEIMKNGSLTEDAAPIPTHWLNIEGTQA